jgi:conjugal transfer pilus assembly protein TraB
MTPPSAWDRLSPGLRRGLVMGGAALALVGVASLIGLTTEEPKSTAPNTERQRRVTNLLTDTDPRALGIEGLAERLRTLEEQLRVLGATVDRTAARPPPANPEQQAELERLRQEHAAQLEGLQREQQDLRARLKDAQAAAPVTATPAPAARPAPAPSSTTASGRLFEPPRTGAVSPPPAGVGKPLEIRTIAAAAAAPGAGGAPSASRATADDAVLLPAGSILRGVLLSGMDAPTGRQARRDPYPALVRIKHDAILPNRFRADVRECFLVAAGYGDLASERAYLRTEAITCIREDGGAIEVPLDAYAVGEDGKVGVRGRLVSKQGQVIGKAMLASFAEGFSQMFGRVPVPVVATTAGTTQPFQQAFSGQAVQAGAVKGVGSALDRLANYFLDMAEEMFPVIEVDAGRGIEFVLNRGATLRLGPGRT